MDEDSLSKLPDYRECFGNSYWKFLISPLIVVKGVFLGFFATHWDALFKRNEKYQYSIIILFLLLLKFKF